MPLPGLPRRSGSCPFGSLQITCPFALLCKKSRLAPDLTLQISIVQLPESSQDVSWCAFPSGADSETSLWEQLDCLGKNTRKQWKQVKKEVWKRKKCSKRVRSPWTPWTTDVQVFSDILGDSVTHESEWLGSLIHQLHLFQSIHSVTASYPCL